MVWLGTRYEAATCSGAGCMRLSSCDRGAGIPVAKVAVTRCVAALTMVLVCAPAVVLPL